MRPSAFCSFEVDHELELDGGLDREIARLFALQYSIDIRCGTPKLLDKIRTIRDQSANFCEGPGPIDGRDTVASSQFRNLCEIVLCEGIGYHDQAILWFVRLRCKARLELGHFINGLNLPRSNQT